ncbi:Katanin p60 ATPase-containing subunit A1 [Acorus calamus]|uniref:Katanin p60 ATPase-containing subunit A1 n=1 Tax=Acorus calamus TaxID=4465 RepID=A0AAV9FJ01_ACOCL|nr:Katanin p60 ATPase-containing subunit A1 [Acorus calamus]
MGATQEKLVQELVLYAASAVLSCLVLVVGLRQLDPNRAASKKALQHKKEIAKRLNRPLVNTTPYEDVIACDVINPDHIDVEFDSIGGLEKVKDELYELVILPLKRPDLFSYGKLLSPQKGVLLYGPPGTGKTMLAKAIAKESGAVFINVKMSNLMSKWFGDAQKLVAAVFSLAYKLQPAIIFIDEVDSFLGQRRSTDHEAMANMKTEFMALWDGFTTDQNARVMVLAATNRPSELDEAILRRFPRPLRLECQIEVRERRF